MEVERGLGFEPTDRELEKLGYDIESRVPSEGRLRFILAVVEILPEDSHRVHYLRQPFQRSPDFGVTSVNYNFAQLLARAEAPR